MKLTSPKMDGALPKIAIIDVGPASRGLISLLQESFITGHADAASSTQGGSDDAYARLMRIGRKVNAASALQPVVVPYYRRFDKRK